MVDHPVPSSSATLRWPVLAFRLPRALRIALRVLAATLTVGIVAVGAIVLVLAHGPIELPMLVPTLTQAIDAQLGGAGRTTIGSAALESGEFGPRLRLRDLALKTSAGQTIVTAPAAAVSIDPLEIVAGRVAVKRIDLVDLAVRVTVQSDGAIALSAGSDPIVLGPKFDPDAPSMQGAALVDDLSGALRRTLDAMTDLSNPVGTIERFGIAHGTLTVDDRRSETTATFHGLDLDFDRRGDSVRLAIAANGAHGRMSASVQTALDASATRSLSLDLHDVSIDDLVTAAGWADPAVTTDAPISGHIALALAQGGDLASASATLQLAKGYVFVADPDQEPIPVDRAKLVVNFERQTQRFTVTSGVFDAGSTHFAIEGNIAAPRARGDPWVIDGHTSEMAALGAERPREQPINIWAAKLQAHVSPAESKFTIDGFSLEGPALQMGLTGALDWSIGPALSLDVSAHKTPGQTVVRIWPSAIASDARTWFLEHLLGGTIDTLTIGVRLTPADFSAFSRHEPPADGDIRVDMKLSGAAVSFLPGVPPLTDVAGSARVTGRTVSFTATNGALVGNAGRKLTLVDGSFTAADTAAHPAPATIVGHLAGSVDSLADILSRDGLKPFVTLPIDTTTVKGQVDGRVQVDLKLGAGATASDSIVKASGTVTNFSADRIIGKERLDSATIQVALDAAGLRAQGQGRVFGAPATVELRKPPVGVTEATIALNLDDAARSKLGFVLPGLSGAIAARVTAALGQSDKTHAQVELDLARATLDGPFPGFSKAAGKPAKATFTATSEASGTTLDGISFDGGGASVRGSVSLDASNALASVHLTQLRFAPGDDIKVDAEQTRETLRIAIRGTALDARALLHGFTSVNEAGSSGGLPANVDVDVKLPVVTGNNKQVLTNVEARISRRASTYRQVQFAGKFGRDTVSATLLRPTESGAPQIQVMSDDAGSFLSFLDLYRRAEGGRFLLFATLAPGRTEGQVRLRDFVVRDEPALRQLVSAGVAAKTPNADGNIDTRTASFTKLQVDFVRSEGRIDLRNGSMFGSQIGTTFEGWLDFAQNRVNVAGTFVPAYGLNNLFSQIPVVGVLLGGNSHEGLLGINYRVSGPANGPMLTINPLSALAPGFLRRIFGARDSNVAPSTPDAPPPPATAGQ